MSPKEFDRRREGFHSLEFLRARAKMLVELVAEAIRRNRIVSILDLFL
jgi:hypothetical protein